MNNIVSERITYLRPDHIFKIDMSGKIDVSKIAEISAALRDSIKYNLIIIKTVKLLFDFRKVQWSEETHMKARKISAMYLKDVLSGSNIFSAILTDRLEGPLSENEFYFNHEQAALDWLRSK